MKWGPNSGYKAAFGLTSWALIGRRYGSLEWRNERTAVTPEYAPPNSESTNPRSFPPHKTLSTGMSLALGVGWRGFRSIKPGATLLRDGGGVQRGIKSPTTPFGSHDTKESQVGSMHSPGRLEEEGCSCLPRCLVWKEKWRQRLTVPISRQPPWSCSSPELSMEKCYWQ